MGLNKIFCFSLLLSIYFFSGYVFERYENVFYYHSTTEQGYSDTRNKREAFEIKNPKLYASIYADVPNDAKDCIGRKFSLGCGLEREKSLQLAIKNSEDNIYVI